MTRPVRGCLPPWPLESVAEPVTNPSVPQQEKQPDITQNEVIVDYDLDIEYEVSEPKNEPVAQAEEEENSDAEYAHREIPQAGTFCHIMMPHDVLQRIKWIHQKQGP